MKHASRASSVVVVLAAFALLASACSPSEAATTHRPAGTARAATGTLPQLLFFMNPNGAPCQMQDGILRDMAGELTGKVELVYYKTTRGEDIAKFRELGIRALPTLVLTDAAGTELRRAPPGIQSAEQVRHLVSP